MLIPFIIFTALLIERAFSRDIRDLPDDVCSVYWAPSTIPGGGYGVFSGKAYDRGEEVGYGDPVIPDVDLSVHNGVHDVEWPFLWYHYEWSADSVLHVEEEGEHIYAFSHGVQAMPNCLYSMINLLDPFHADFDTVGLHRSKDPGVGAFTPIHNRVTLARRYLRPGEELFLWYGPWYFNRQAYKSYHVPQINDHHEADRLLEDILDLFDWVIESTECEEEQVECNVQYEKQKAVQRDFHQWIIHDLYQVWPNAAFNALPRESDHLEDIADIGTENQYWDRSIRDVDWLKQNGYCLDKLVPGNSTIPQAGRGAFARVPLQAGEVIAPMPLIHIKDRRQLNMYDYNLVYDEDAYAEVRNTSRLLNQQLWLNYCFGHRESTLLLCPYSMSNGLINHSRKPNARIVWSERLTRHAEWFDQPLTAWVDTLHVGLAFELLALRKIDRGEEVLIDYGDEWDQAWKEHVRHWKPPPGADKYVDAATLNRQAMVLHTTTIYSSSNTVDLVCVTALALLEVFDAEWEMCRVTHRIPSRTEFEEDTYVVELLGMYYDNDDEVDGVCFLYVREIVWDLARCGIRFRDRPYSRDHAQPWSFRHDLRIPDDLFPVAWKNQNE